MSGVTDSNVEKIREQYGQFNKHRYAPLVKAFLGFGLLAMLPNLLSVSVAGFSLAGVFSMELLVITLIFATASQAWNIMTGYTGYFSFGHATFFGSGAYITMKLLVDFSINPWIGMVVGAVFATAVGLFIGFLTFRYELEGHYFALTTLAFAVMFRAFARNMQEFNEALGFYKPLPRAYGEEMGLLAFQWGDPQPYFYLILAFLAVVTAVAWVLRNSAIGIYLFAIKEDEDAARSLGIPVYRYKMLAIGISAFFTACVGAFWSMYFSTIKPNTVFAIAHNVEILLPTIFGGIGTVAGPILGAFIVLPFSEIMRQSVGSLAGFDRIVYGIAIVFIVIYSPRGVIYWPKRLGEFRQWLARKYGLGTHSAEDDHE